jgi:hypothetical protein
MSDHDRFLDLSEPASDAATYTPSADEPTQIECPYLCGRCKARFPHLWADLIPEHTTDFGLARPGRPPRVWPYLQCPGSRQPPCVWVCPLCGKPFRNIWYGGIAPGHPRPDNGMHCEGSGVSQLVLY